MYKKVSWFLKAVLDQSRYLFNLSWYERWQNLKFLWIAVLILTGFTRKGNAKTNSFFNLWDLCLFSSSIRQIIFFHPKMARVILDLKHKGVRAWEYGSLLSRVKLTKGMKILDLGSGASALPFYLAKKGIKVTAVDLEDPLEQVDLKLLAAYPQIHYHRGSMTNLPYDNQTFDLVTCITAIEHLDYDFSQKQALDYVLFLRRTKKALSEMVRVLKKSGRLFLTSDLYFPNWQQSDRYQQSFFYKDRIGAAFKISDFDKIFIQELKKLGCRMIGQSDYDFSKIRQDINRANFRGRYFTTFAIYAKKS